MWAVYFFFVICCCKAYISQDFVINVQSGFSNICELQFVQSLKTAYKPVNVDPMNYVSLFTLQHILHDNSFGVVRFQLAFPMRWRKKKMNDKVEKNVKFTDNRAIT